jgi:hypothetical protein
MSTGETGMVDGVLIQQCIDPPPKPVIAEQFIQRAGQRDPLMIAVRAGNRFVLVSRSP